MYTYSTLNVKQAMHLFWKYIKKKDCASGNCSVLWKWFALILPQTLIMIVAWYVMINMSLSIEMLQQGSLSYLLLITWISPMVQ